MDSLRAMTTSTCGPSRAAVILIPWLILGLNGSAYGDEAKSRYDRAVELLDQDRVADACFLLEKSLEFDGAIATKDKLAECYARLGRTASAWRLYQVVEQSAIELGDRGRARRARKRAKELKPRAARIVIDPGPSVFREGFAVGLDSVTVYRTSYDQPIYVDPGSHMIEAHANGHDAYRIAVQLGEGDERMVAIPALDSRGLVSAPNRGSPRPRLAGCPRLRLAGGILVGVGAVGLASGTYFGLVARSDWNTVKANCNGVELCRFENDRLYERAQNNATLSSVSFAVGLVSVAVGAGLWWRGRGSSRDGRSGADESAVVVPMIGPDAVGAVIHIRR